MLTFLLLFFPSIILIHYLWNKNNKMVLVALVGIIASVVLAACKSFFFLAHRVVSYSFTDNFVYYLTRESVVPVIVVFALYLLVSRDSLDFKLQSVFSLEAGFYAIYLPYCVFNSELMEYSFYPIFFKPLVYGAMLAQLGISMSFISDKQKKILVKVLFGVLIPVYLVLPAVFDSLYCIENNTVILGLFCILFSIIPFGFAIFTGCRKLLK